MLRELWLLPPLGERFRQALTIQKKLTARIRRTPEGVRIRFSDGRLAWLNSEPRVSESGFLGSVSDWARRHGAQSVELEFD